MKLLAVMVLLSNVVFGYGKVSVNPNYSLTKNKYYPIVGLVVYEDIIKNDVSYQSWTGFGEEIYDHYDWFITKHEVDFYWNKLSLSPGYKFKYVVGDRDIQHDIGLNLKVKIWD